ncbi:MAG: dUTP diphosphatase [Anaerofustis sp.]
MEKIEIKLVNHSPYPSPSYETEGSAGADIRANLAEPLLIEVNGIVLIPTGLYLALPFGYEAQIRSRSGMTLKHGIVVANGVGTIDSDYRGEIKVVLHNISQEDYRLQPGERIAQMIISPCIHASFFLTDELSSTDRGTGGFGHTGK